MRKGKKARAKIKRILQGGSSDIAIAVNLQNHCPICRELLTTPVKLCNHFVDALCFVSIGCNFQCQDNTCNIAPATTFQPFPFHKLNINHAKVNYIRNHVMRTQEDQKRYQTISYNSMINLDECKRQETLQRYAYELLEEKRTGS